jgi:hypothetical protein
MFQFPVCDILDAEIVKPNSKNKMIGAVIFCKNNSDKYTILVKNYSDVEVYVFGMSIEMEDNSGKFLDNRGSGFSPYIAIPPGKATCIERRMNMALDFRKKNIQISSFALTYSKNKDGSDNQDATTCDLYLCQ